MARKRVEPRAQEEPSISMLIGELIRELDHWEREAAKGTAWLPLHSRAVYLCCQLESKLREQGFAKQADEVHRFHEQLTGASPTLGKAISFLHHLGKWVLHALTDRAA
jgi:hypothetical protein